MTQHNPPGDFPDDENPLGEILDSLEWDSPGAGRGKPAGMEHDAYESERKVEKPDEGGAPPRPWFLAGARPVTMVDVMQLMNPDPPEEEHQETETGMIPWSEDEIRDVETDEAEEDVSYRIPPDDLDPEETFNGAPGWNECLEKALEAMRRLGESYPGLPECAYPLQARRLTKEERNRNLFTSRQGEWPETFDTPEEMLRRQALPMDARFWKSETIERFRKNLAGKLQGPNHENPDGILVYLPVGPVIEPKEEFLMAWWQWVWTHVVEPQPCDVPRTEILAAWKERLNLEDMPDRFNEWMYREIARSLAGYGSSIDDFPELLAELEGETGEEESPF